MFIVKRKKKKKTLIINIVYHNTDLWFWSQNSQFKGELHP